MRLSHCHRRLGALYAVLPIIFAIRGKPPKHSSLLLFLNPEDSPELAGLTHCGWSLIANRRRLMINQLFAVFPSVGVNHKF